MIGAGRVFIAGSELKEFGQPFATPELPDVIRAIEAAPFPVIAAMHGVALGDGFELAQGCDYRVAAPGTMVGLPKVSLSLVPGAGGTQRPARLVGQARAIDPICAARWIDAVETLQALSRGIKDRIVLSLRGMTGVSPFSGFADTPKVTPNQEYRSGCG